MIITDTRIKVTLDMLKEADLFREPNEIGVPDRAGTVVWVHFDDLQNTEYDALEEYFETKYPEMRDRYQPLFDLMSGDYDLTLTAGEMDEIAIAAKGILAGPDKPVPDPAKLECSDALADLLETLRRNQRAFFASQPGSLVRQTALQESKRLEKALDEFLQERKAPKKIDLFNQ